ncbi:MAG: hypothetical protein VX222_07780, partial [Actinomycetota bacterium]|nr:hypothetical protein [Actinomycetota bacterium]
MNSTSPPTMVTIVLDTIPRSGIDPTGWRTEQICKEFIASNAETRLILNGPADDRDNLYGATLETTGLDSTDWWRTAHSDIFMFCGNSSAYRMVSLCRVHNPDTTIIVDGTTLLTLQRPDLADDLVADDELAGRDTVASLRRQRDREVIALADH